MPLSLRILTGLLLGVAIGAALSYQRLCQTNVAGPARR